ncbi:hypothetical protein ABZ686_14325 [Streptomyces sp. NPDC006992]|uniref:hypothetical protein n=1 Tax=Streptomyces sp. NPDC006992 TaxID=3155601 RepID=UPI0033D3D0E5
MTVTDVDQELPCGELGQAPRRRARRAPQLGPDTTRRCDCSRCDVDRTSAGGLSAGGTAGPGEGCAEYPAGAA